VGGPGRYYVGAFFELHLLHQDRHVFDQSTPKFPEAVVEQQ